VNLSGEGCSKFERSTIKLLGIEEDVIRIYLKLALVEE